ncbi:MAG: 1-deoxy-D-xylulose-5-phosphate synthase, partial [Eggerthellaceae bacterium]|nr:1-deoxy-D-xylulose-5-phosphate synthase [Eggerthellaceae bacterium]
MVNSPQDLKVLTDEELEILAQEIREEIITVTSKNGGHVASSLGAVEIILAVHSLIDAPKDKFIFDVGHQAYA